MLIGLVRGAASSMGSADGMKILILRLYSADRMERRCRESDRTVVGSLVTITPLA